MVYEQVCRRCLIEPEVYVDGYYGASLTDLYQTYNTVVLVGGGVGLTPLLGILEDICATAESRQAQGRNLLPRRVAAVFVMRELELLKEIYPLVVRVRDLDPQGRYITINLTVTTTPRPDELDASINTCASLPKILPSTSFSQTRTFASANKNGCPFGAAFSSSGSSMVHFVAFAIVVGLVVVLQFGNGSLIDGLQGSVWLVQLAVKTSAMFATGAIVYCGVVTMRWTRSARASSKRVQSQYSVDEVDLKETLLPQARSRAFSPEISTFRNLVSELHVKVGGRPDIAEILRELHREHRQRFSGDESTIGVIVSGPTTLKTATSRAVTAISASDFDIHEEEFEL